MANEISVTSGLSLNRTTAPASSVSKNASVQVDQSAATGGFVFGSAVIGASEETLEKSDITTIGWVWVKNLTASGSNYVSLGSVSGQRPVLAYPGETAGPVRINAAEVYIESSSGNQNIEFVLIES